ncbi:MAG: hypothetical protein WKF75_08560 [Singulisphaera sp.]
MESVPATDHWRPPALGTGPLQRRGRGVVGLGVVVRLRGARRHPRRVHGPLGAGRVAHAEEYQGRLAEADPADLVVLVYHEYCLAESSGLDPDPADYLRRFPGHTIGWTGSSACTRSWTHRKPKVGRTRVAARGRGRGQSVPPAARLGRGGSARVFLAEQSDLEHRLVVLKVSTRATSEPLLLARARHAHIVEAAPASDDRRWDAATGLHALSGRGDAG